MAWEIEWAEDAAKEFRKLNKTVQKEIRDYLVRRIAPAADPRRFGKPLKRNLSGLWRYRIADYRVICKIKDDTVTIMVLWVAHRRHIYQ